MNCLRAGAALVLGVLLALAPVASAQQEPGPAVLPADAAEGLPPIVAQDDPWAVCAGAIAAAEPASNLPPGLLLAISLVESGRRNPETGLRTPWPWSWNAGGESGYAETREEAIAAVRAIMDEGQRSVDIGCMQVNLLQHPNAFSSVEEAFDPARNAGNNLLYGAGVHVCPGAPLARLELRVLMQALLAGTHAIGLTAESAPQRASFPGSGFAVLPLRLQ